MNEPWNIMPSERSQSLETDYQHGFIHMKGQEKTFKKTENKLAAA